MPNKDRELRYVEALRRALSDFPTGDVVPAETPDVLVQSSGSTIGIEVTVFHIVEGDGSKRPHQEQQALKDRVVERAWSRHVRDGGPALYVSVHFNSSPLDKASVASVADSIVAAIARLGKEPPSDGELAVPWRDLPPQVSAASRLQPAGRMEQFFRDLEKRGQYFGAGTPEERETPRREYGIVNVGPPLSI